MHVSRDLRPVLLETFDKFPILTIVGPRQSGKTTLAKAAFPELAYVNLEDIGILEELEYDPKGFLERFKDGAIFDEVQRFPRLLSYLQARVDESNKNGQFILTGSNQQALSSSVSQSLAGRTVIFSLLPLTFHELQKEKLAKISLDQILLQGFFPKLYKDNIEPQLVYQSYLQTYIERDVRQLLNIKDLFIFQRFMKLCAGRIGQLFNYNSFANELGLSVPTIKSWLSVLESSYIIKMLPPYFENFGKRITKTPKLYFTDVGLASYLLDIQNTTQLSRDPLRGQLFENLVVIDIYKHHLNLGLNTPMYFFRDHNQNEVDILCKMSSGLIPIEVKSSQTFNPRFLKGLEYFNNISNPESPFGILAYAGEDKKKVKTFEIINYQYIANELASNY